MGVQDGYIYDFAFYTPSPGGGCKTSRFAIDASDVMGDMCRVLFVDDTLTNDPIIFALPRDRMMEMIRLMADKEGGS